MQTEEFDVSKVLKERFAQLPKVVQQAILSSHVEEHLRELSKEYKLHLDQWVDLENEVMMVLLGFRPITELAKHIAEEARVPKETAEAIAEGASRLVFEPIRKELERELEHPNAEPKEITPEEKQRQEMLAEAHAAEGDTSTPQSVSSAPSTSRTTIEGDPYREPVK